jgi:hypothetical protein
MAKRKDTADEPTASSQPTHEQVAQRAYDIFLARGGVDGMDLDDWFRAERELKITEPSVLRPIG